MNTENITKKIPLKPLCLGLSGSLRDSYLQTWTNETKAMDRYTVFLIIWLKLPKESLSTTTFYP